MPVPVRVYIFDGVDADDLTGMNNRVATCYAWANQHGATVLDEVLSWAPRHSAGRQLALMHAVAACRRDRAALLVHSEEVLPPDRCTLTRPPATPVLTASPAAQQHPAHEETA